MVKKRSFTLLTCLVLLMQFQLSLKVWGCDRALLHDEIQECCLKLSHGNFLDKQKIVDSLKFLYDETDFKDFNYENFIQAQEGFKDITITGFDHYHSFAKDCCEIYEKGNNREKVAISMLFKNVSKQCFSYYNCASESFPTRNPTKNFCKSKKYHYPSLVYTMELVTLIEYFPSDIRLFIDSTLMCLVERDYPSLKGELLRCLLINGNHLHTRTLEKISDKAFYLISGIKRITFEKMVTILQQVLDLKKSRTGRKNKLSAENIILMALEYFGGNGTHVTLGESYELAPSTVYRNVKSVENIFANDLKLNLPEIFDKRKDIANDLISNSIAALRK